jgi:hypothetical protein
MTNPNNLQKIHEMIETAQANLQIARQLLDDMAGGGLDTDTLVKQPVAGRMTESDEGKVIEGIFDGQNMFGPDGKQYSVPANYASKSKLIEGDTLKLTITGDGSFIYKQIGPTDRTRLIGILTRDEETHEYRVLANNKSYRVLLASITYFKGEPGDEVVVLIPKDKDTKWAAVENIIKKASGVSVSDLIEQPAVEEI